MRLGHCVQTLQTQLPSFCCHSFRPLGERQIWSHSESFPSSSKASAQFIRASQQVASTSADSVSARSVPDLQVLDDRRSSHNGTSTSNRDDDIPHVPVLLDEVFPRNLIQQRPLSAHRYVPSLSDSDSRFEASAFLQVLLAFRGRSMRTFVDGTLGAGGHSAAVLSQHPHMQLLIGIDKDPVAHAIARKCLEQAKAEAQSGVKLQQVLVCTQTLP